MVFRCEGKRLYRSKRAPEVKILGSRGGGTGETKKTQEKKRDWGEEVGSKCMVIDAKQTKKPPPQGGGGKRKRKSEGIPGKNYP